MDKIIISEFTLDCGQQNTYIDIDSTEVNLIYICGDSFREFHNMPLPDSKKYHLIKGTIYNR